MPTVYRRHGQARNMRKAPSMSGRKRKSMTRSANMPRFSIIITAWKRDGNAPTGAIRRGISRQEYPLSSGTALPRRRSISRKAKTSVDESLRQRRDDSVRAARETAAAASRRQDHHGLERLDDFRLCPRRAGAGRSDLSGIGDAAAEFVRDNLYDETTQDAAAKLSRRPSEVEGFAETTRFHPGLARSLRSSFDVDWLQFALELQATQDRLFWDEKNGGYFTSTGDDKSILLRMKEDNDNAEPAASSVAALNLLRFAQIRGDEELSRARGENDRGFCRRFLDTSPSAHAADAGRARSSA